MALGEVTDSKAVIVAIAEFDDVGRDAFLKKYGFSKARSYFIRSDGRRYDSKAIVGAARGYQHPQVGPLSAQEFSGGEAAAVRVLRKLGFEVLKLGGPSRAPRYWAFCANPKRYKIAEAVLHLDIDLWNVARSDVRAGDQAIVWQTLDEETGPLPRVRVHLPHTRESCQARRSSASRSPVRPTRISLQRWGGSVLAHSSVSRTVTLSGRYVRPAA